MSEKLSVEELARRLCIGEIEKQAAAKLREQEGIIETQKGYVRFAEKEIERQHKKIVRLANRSNAQRKEIKRLKGPKRTNIEVLMDIAEQEMCSKLDEYIEYMAPAEHEYQPLHVAAFREIRDTLKKLTSRTKQTNTDIEYWRDKVAALLESVKKLGGGK